MVDKIHNVIDSTRRRIVVSYNIALMMIAAVVISIATLTGHLVDAEIADASIMKISGQQNVLSQRISLLAHQLVNASESERRDVLQSLKSTITALETNHQLLLEDAKIDDGAVGHSALLMQLYYAAPLQLDYQVREYVKHAITVLQAPVGSISAVSPELVTLSKQASGRLRESFDAAVDRYESETIRRFDLLHNVVIGLSILAIFMLAMVALFVFRPAIAFVAQAQKRLLELNQLKGDFLANMSHEIRTPMNGIFGMTELLLDSSLNARQQHYTRTLQSSADHLLGLINDILDFSKLEAGQMKLDPIRFNLVATIEDVLELLASRAREKNLELLMRYLPGTPRFVVADPGRIRQVLFNLIGNAIKFTDKGYVIVHIEMLPQKKANGSQLCLIIRIEDTGIGIPEDKIANLFEKFMQVETGSTRARQGTGLGLAISRNLLGLMGGTISVESHPGKGTIFTCHIPLAEASEPQPALYPHETLTNKRVLLVDDLAPNRLLYKEALAGAGVECLVAENAEETLSMLAYAVSSGQVIDAVVTDYMMPDMDGLRLTQSIKSDARFTQIPVIILSSAGEQGLIQRFDAVGASACLSKPATRQQLIDTLAHVIMAAEQGIQQTIITAEASASLNARRLLTRERPLNGTHILLVEDNRVNMEITTEMLHQFGCEVTPAVNGHEALKAVKNKAFDLIFMDCQMPEMDGFEAARHIVSLKAAGQIASVPIVALTANALKGDRERCLESGMDDYLSKPMRKVNLEAILLKWLRVRLEAHAEVPVALSLGNAPEIKLQGSAHSTYSPEQYGVDAAAFESAREMLGNKLQTILTYYLEDAQEYIDRIDESVTKRHPQGAVVPAHTLKSSSRQLGVHGLAALAERAETTARAQNKGGDMRDLAELLPDMRQALAQVRPFFESAMAA